MLFVVVEGGVCVRVLFSSSVTASFVWSLSLHVILY